MSSAMTREKRDTLSSAVADHGRRPDGSPNGVDTACALHGRSVRPCHAITFAADDANCGMQRHVRIECRRRSAFREISAATAGSWGKNISVCRHVFLNAFFAVSRVHRIQISPGIHASGRCAVVGSRSAA